MARRDANGMTMVNRDIRLHQTGVYKGASDNPMNHYSTTYSTTHQFKESRGLNERTDHDLQSGFAQNFHHTSKGLNMEPAKPVTNYTSTYNAGYTDEVRDDRNKILPLNAPDPVRPFQGGFSRNYNNVAPDNRNIGADTTHTAEFQRTAPVRYEEYDHNNRFSTVQPQVSGFVTNNRQQGTQKLAQEDANEWMKTTTVEQQEKSDACPAQGLVDMNHANKARFEHTGFSRGIQVPPADGTGSEHMKVHGSMMPAARTGYVGAPWEMTNTQGITEAQERKILDKMRREEPLKYQHALDGQQTYQSTYNLAHQAKTTDLLNKGHDLLHGQVGSAGMQPGDTYVKDLHGFYSTTTKRNQAFEATRQAYTVNESKVIGSGYVTTGFTQNNKDPYCQKPWLNDMSLRAGNDVFSKGRTSNDVIGAPSDRRQIAGASIGVLHRRRYNEPASAYMREHTLGPIPTGGVPGANAISEDQLNRSQVRAGHIDIGNPGRKFAGSRPSSREYRGTVASIKAHDRVTEIKPHSQVHRAQAF